MIRLVKDEKYILDTQSVSNFEIVGYADWKNTHQI